MTGDRGGGGRVNVLRRKLTPCHFSTRVFILLYTETSAIGFNFFSYQNHITGTRVKFIYFHSKHIMLHEVQKNDIQKYNNIIITE